MVLDPETLEGSGPNGRVIERDVEAVISGRPRLSASAVSKARDGMEPPIRGKDWQDGTCFRYERAWCY